MATCYTLPVAKDTLTISNLSAVQSTDHSAQSGLPAFRIHHECAHACSCPLSIPCPKRSTYTFLPPCLPHAAPMQASLCSTLSCNAFVQRCRCIRVESG